MSAPVVRRFTRCRWCARTLRGRRRNSGFCSTPCELEFRGEAEIDLR